MSNNIMYVRDVIPKENLLVIFFIEFSSKFAQLRLNVIV